MQSVESDTYIFTPYFLAVWDQAGYSILSCYYFLNLFNGRHFRMSTLFCIIDTQLSDFVFVFQNSCNWTFLGGPVVRTLGFHFRRHGFNPWSENQDTISCSVLGKKKQKFKFKIFSDNKIFRKRKTLNFLDYLFVMIVLNKQRKLINSLTL